MNSDGCKIDDHCPKVWHHILNHLIRHHQIFLFQHLIRYVTIYDYGNSRKHIWNSLYVVLNS